MFIAPMSPRYVSRDLVEGKTHFSFSYPPFFFLAGPTLQNGLAAWVGF